jgi:hypothetical protein
MYTNPATWPHLKGMPEQPRARLAKLARLMRSLVDTQLREVSVAGHVDP